jgi:hypothetical protein
MTKSIHDLAREAIAKGPVTAAEKRETACRVINDYEEANAAMVVALVPEWRGLAHHFTWEGRKAMLRSIR